MQDCLTYYFSSPQILKKLSPDSDRQRSIFSYQTVLYPYRIWCLPNSVQVFCHWPTQKKCHSLQFFKGIVHSVGASFRKNQKSMYCLLLVSTIVLFLSNLVYFYIKDNVIHGLDHVAPFVLTEGRELNLWPIFIRSNPINFFVAIIILVHLLCFLLLIFCLSAISISPNDPHILKNLEVVCHFKSFI